MSERFLKILRKSGDFQSEYEESDRSLSILKIAEWQQFEMHLLAFCCPNQDAGRAMSIASIIVNFLPFGTTTSASSREGDAAITFTGTQSIGAPVDQQHPIATGD